MQDFEEIRNRFIKIYKHFGENYSELGRICGVTHTAIKNIVAGTAKSFDVSILSNLNKNATEINLNWLITGTGSMLKEAKEKNHDESYLTDNKDLETIKKERDSYKDRLLKQYERYQALEEKYNELNARHEEAIKKKKA